MRHPIWKFVSVALLLCAGALTLSSIIARHRTAAVESLIRTELDVVRGVLVESALLVDRNSPDQALAAIYSDCSKRNEYEFLLVNLSSLTRSELGRLSELSESCGRYFPVTKALMVERLERLVTRYATLVTFLFSVHARDALPYRVDDWRELAAAEHERSDLLFRQNELQDTIITALLAGDSGSRVRNSVSEAQRIAIELTNLDSRIDALRAELTK